MPRPVAIVSALLIALVQALPASSAVHAGPSISSTSVEHGGGCRKSSPPGQCCHMEKKVGRVHCH